MSDVEIFLGNQDPNFIIHIDDKEIPIKVFFSMSCCEKYFELCEIADYRSAFAWMIYYMFSQSSSYNEEIKEDDFLRISDDELKQIIQSIISDDTALKDVFERVEVENIYPTSLT